MLNGDRYVCRDTLDVCKCANMPHYHKFNNKWDVQCSSCGESTDPADSLSEAMVKWNKKMRGVKD